MLSSVSGHITTDTVWDDTTQPYTLTEDLYVDPGVTLTAMPGVQIASWNSNWDLIVDGSFEGSEVTFQGSHFTLQVASTGEAAVSDSTFAYQSQGVHAYGQVSLTDVLFLGGGSEVHAYSGSSVTLSGVSFLGPFAGVLNCDAGSAGSATLVSGSFVANVSAASTIGLAGNDFSQATVQLTGDPGAVVDLEGNWWGDPVAAAAEARLLDHTDDPARPYSDYDPLLLLPPRLSYVGAITGPGSAAVHVYDTEGTGEIELSDISVVFTDGDTISHIDLNGDGAMSGLGLVVTGVDSAGTINDYRTAPGDVAFLASTGQFANVNIAGNVAGYDLNGLALQDGDGGDVIVFAPDVDGDGDTDDPLALYVGDYVQGNVKVQGTWTGDVWIEGSNTYNWSLKVMHVYGGAFAGDFRAPGKVGVLKSYGDYTHVVDVGPELRYFLVYDGDFSGQVSTTGPMYAFLVDGGDILGGSSLTVNGVVQRNNRSQSWGTAGEAIHFVVLRSGVFRAGATVHADNGSIFRANLPDHETDNGGEGFGVWAGGPYRYIMLGDTYVNAPYTDGDFMVMRV
jgi:hypothetical protein